MRVCAMSGCLERRVARLIGESYACDRHATMLLHGDTRELIAESARLLADARQGRLL
jgi:hypothetical protein